MDALNGLASFLRASDVVIDNWVFRLHYQFTSTLLVCFSIVVVSDQFFGDPINCMTTLPYDDGIPEDVINNFCWIHATYTLPKAYDVQGVAHPGVANRLPEDEVVYHAYYQWVSLFLFLQAILFYAPRYLWTQSDVTKILLRRLEDDAPPLVLQLLDAEGTHGWQALAHVLCELLNLANVVGQIFFTDRFLGGEFTTYGTEVVRFAATDQANRTDPMIEIFPRVTKCTFRQHGPSGSIQNHDTLCVLPINVINEKIFIFLWFWYVVLAAVSLLAVLFRLSELLFERLRSLLLGVGLPPKAADVADQLVADCTLGDWFMLRLWKKNLVATEFADLILDYHGKRRIKKMD